MRTTTPTAYRAALAVGIAGLAALVIVSLPFGRSHPDDFYLGRLFMDLYREGGRWSDWIPPSAPSLFPDGLIYGILALFTMDILWVSALYGLVIALGTGAVVYGFARSSIDDRSAALLVVCLALLGMVGFGEDLTTWSRPSQHFLSYFNLVLGGALLFASLRRPWVLPWMGLLVAVAVLSDFLFVPLWLGASGGLLGMAWAVGALSLRRALAVLAAAIASLLLGYVAYRWLVPHPQDNPVWASGMSLRDVATSLPPHLNALGYLSRNLLSAWFLVPLAMFLLAAWLCRGDRIRLPRLLVSGGFIFGGILANLYTVGLGFHATMSREQYHIFIWNGEILLFAMAMGFLAWRLPRLLAPLFIVLGITSGVLAARAPGPAERIANYRPFAEEVACIADQAGAAGLRYGLASFGNSDRFTVVSDGRLFLNTLTGERLRTKHYVLSRAWNRQRFDFVLIDNDVDTRVYERKKMHYPIADSVAREALGPPDRTLVCKQHTLLVYDRGIQCLENTLGTFDCVLAD